MAAQTLWSCSFFVFMFLINSHIMINSHVWSWLQKKWHGYDHCHVSSFPVITCMAMFDIDMAGDLQLRKFGSGSCLAPPPETIAPAAFHSQDSAKKGRSTDQLTLRWKQHTVHRLFNARYLQINFSQFQPAHQFHPRRGTDRSIFSKTEGARWS